MLSPRLPRFLRPVIHRKNTDNTNTHSTCAIRKTVPFKVEQNPPLHHKYKPSPHLCDRSVLTSRNKFRFTRRRYGTQTFMSIWDITIIPHELRDFTVNNSGCTEQRGIKWGEVHGPGRLMTNSPPETPPREAADLYKTFDKAKL